MGSHRSAAAAAAPHDVRSVKLVEMLRARWKREIKKLPPAQRESWLKSQEAIVALGAQRCHELRKAVEKERRETTAIVPSKAWDDAFAFEGLRLPSFTVSHAQDGRRYAVRMKLSRFETRIGLDGDYRRRLTPPQAVEVEDFLDGMERIRAEFYSYPPSPSALAIFKVNTYGGAERGRFPGKRRGRRGQWFGGGY